MYFHMCGVIFLKQKMAYFLFSEVMFVFCNRGRLPSVEASVLTTTGELGYDGLNGTRKIGPSYAKSVVYI